MTEGIAGTRSGCGALYRPGGTIHGLGDEGLAPRDQQPHTSQHTAVLRGSLDHCAPLITAYRAPLREMSAVSGAEPSPAAAGGRVFFQTPLGAPGAREDPPPVPAQQHKQQQQKRQQQGKVTVKYDRKELRKRLVLEEWIVEQLSELYGCEEEEMPEVEIDIDDLLDAASEEERVVKLQESLVDCFKPTEEFINQLLSRIRGMRKLSPPQKKDI